MNEIFKPIPDWPNYEVSNLGRVRNVRFNRFLTLTPKPCNRGISYPSVWLSPHGRKKQFLVHSLVLRVFVGERPDGQHVRHKDRDTNNCCLSNLEYGTPADNKQDSIKHETYAHGNTHGNSILSERTVRIAKVLHRCDFSVKRIAQILSVSRSTIYHVLQGRSWKHVSVHSNYL